MIASFTLPLVSVRLLNVAVIVLLIVVLPLCSSAQHKDSLLVWQGQGKLSLMDFKHTPDSFAIKNETSNKASSLLDIKMDVPQFIKFDTAFSYNITAVFYKYLSWLYDTTQLRHERLHFDLSELYARKMRSSLHHMKIDYESYNMVKTKLNDLYYEHAKTHVLYDKETRNGKMPNMQLRWERNVEIQLDTLKQYESPTGYVKMARIKR
jgi:hypothetical protein